MKICIASPEHGQGNSIVSIFIGMSLALLKKKKVCLTHTDFSNNILKELFSFPDIRDVTTSLTQVTKLIQTRSIKSDDLLNYTSQVMSGFYLYSTYQPPIEENLFVKNYEILINNMQSFNHIIIDFDLSGSEIAFDKCIEVSDLIVITINQNNKVISLSYSPYIPKCGNKGLIEECFLSAINNDIRTACLKQDMVEFVNIYRV